MSAVPPAIAAEIAAAGRSQLEFDDNLLLPALYGERDQHLDRIERQLGVATGSRSPGRPRPPRSLASRCPASMTG